MNKKDGSMATRNELLNTAAKPVEVRNGVARFEDGTRIHYRPVEVRANSAVEVTDEATGKKKRTVEVIWTKGASVLRYSWRDDEVYEEVLEVTEESVDLGRLREGGSVLNSHNSWDLQDVIGSVLEARIADGVGYATIQISNRASCDELWQDIQDGIVRHISVGYSVLRTEKIEAEGEMTIRKVTLWEPHEISFVAVPADAGCSVRSKSNAPTNRNTETNVSKETTTPESVPANDTAAQRAAEVRELEFRRIAARCHTAEADLDAAIADTAVTVDSFRNAQIDALAARANNTSISTVRVGRTLDASPEQEMQLRAEMFTAEAIEAYGLGTAEAPSEQARQYAGEGTRGAAEAFLRSINVTGFERKSDAVVIGEALARSVGGGFSSSDFIGMVTRPAIVALDNGFRDTLAETTYQNWTGDITVKDGNLRETFSASLFNGIGPISEDGELPLAKMSGASYQVGFTTSGLEIAITRMALINDDLGLFYSNLRDLGMSWALYNEAKAINTLKNGKIKTATGSKSIFSQAAGNVIDIAALDKTGFTAMVLALRTQKVDPKLGGQVVPTAPKFLMVSPDLEAAANEVAPNGVIQNSNAPNAWANRGIQVVVNDSFDAETAILTGSLGMKNMIKRVRLAGQNGPQLERMAQTSSQRVVWHSYEDADFVGASQIGAVKANITGGAAPGGEG